MITSNRATPAAAETALPAEVGVVPPKNLSAISDDASAPASAPTPPEIPLPSDTILLEFDGPVAVMTNNRPEKHNAANDEMDARLWEVLAEIHETRIAMALAQG